MRIQLCLGDCSLSVIEESNRPTIFWPDPPWDLFEVPFEAEAGVDIQLKIKVVPKLAVPPSGALIFDSGRGLWRLFKIDSGYFLETRHPRSKIPFRHAFISEDFSQVEVLARETVYLGKRGWTPAQVISPIAELCLHTWLARRGASMMHASGVVTENGAWAFIGPSGAGKSTIAAFFEGRALARLSDETVFLRKSDKGFKIYGTPWLGSGRIASAENSPLSHLFFIRHGQKFHHLKPLGPREISRLFFEQCLLPLWDRVAMQKTAEFFEELSAQIPCYDLAFLKAPDVVDFLQEQISNTHCLSR